MATHYIIYPTAVAATSVTANQGAPGALNQPWPVKPTDGTNFQSFTGANEAKVSVTQPLPVGANVIGGVTGSGNFTVVQPTGTSLHTVVDSGSITAVQPVGTNLHTVVDNFPVTQPVSGTVTVIQPTGTNLHAVVDSGSITAVQATGTNLHAVIDNFPVTQPVSGTVTANIGTSGALALDASVTALSAKFNSLGQKAMAASAPVVIASDQSAIPVTLSQTQHAKVNIIRNDYTGTAVTTAAYVQLVASTAADIYYLDIFDSSGQTLVFAVGAAASEVNQFNIYPGGNGHLDLFIPSGSRLSVKAVSATASVGELDINTFS